MQDQAKKPELGVLKKSIVAGTWMTAGNIIQKLIGVASFFVLARLLKPTDFGLMAIIFIIPKFIESISETGMETAILQKKGDVSKYLNPIWTIEVFKAIGIMILIYIFGPYIAIFFHAEEATLWIRLGGVFIFIKNLSNIGGETSFSRELDFKKISIKNVARDATMTIVSIILALVWPSYIILFFANLASHIVQVGIIYILHPYRPKFSFDFSSLKELAGYSKWYIVQRWINIPYNLIESSVVARLTTTAEIGFFSKAKNLASVIPGLLVPMMDYVGFSAFSKIQDNRDKINAGFQKTLDLLFFVFIPTSLVLGFAGKKFILILLGPEWQPMTSTFQIFLLYYFFDTFNTLSRTLFNAVALTKQQTSFAIIRTTLTAALIIPFTLHWGIFGAAVALVLGNLPTVFLNIQALIKLTLLNGRAIVKSVFWPTSISIFLLTPVLIWKDFFSGLPLFAFLGATATLGLVYLIIIYFLGVRFHRGPYLTLKVVFEHLF